MIAKLAYGQVYKRALELQWALLLLRKRRKLKILEYIVINSASECMKRFYRTPTSPEIHKTKSNSKARKAYHDSSPPKQVIAAFISETTFSSNRFSAPEAESTGF